MTSPAIPQPREHFFPAPNLEGPEGTHRLHMLDWGDADNARIVVCVHGLTRNAHDFDYIARALAADYRVLSISMAGRGQSDKLEHTANYNYAAYMADCIALLNHFHLRAVDWIGTSMGGIIGMMIAAMHPDRIRRLILNDIGAYLPKEALTYILDYVSNTPASFPDRICAEEYMRTIFTTFGVHQEEHWEHLFRYSIIEERDGACHFAFDPHILDPIRTETNHFTELHDLDLSELWDAVHCPTLILRGAESTVLEAETVSAMRSGNLRCRSVEFPNVGHAPMLMEDDQIRVVTDWLNNKGKITVTKQLG